MSAQPGPSVIEWDDVGGIKVVRFNTRSLRDDRLIRAIFQEIDQLLVGTDRRVVLNFAGVEAFASYTIGKLVALNDRLPPEGRLALCCLTSTINEIIDIMRLRKKLQIYKTEREALDSFV
jgi:anti-anti-sigma regulatory factor